MKGAFAALNRRLNARAPRERVLIAVATLVVVMLMGDLLVLQPLRDRADRESARIDAATESIAETAATLDELQARLRDDPNAGRRARIASLEARRDALDARLRARSLALVDPAEMASLLRSLMDRSEGLELVRLESEPVEPVALGFAKGTAEGGAPSLYRHGVVLEFRGGYEDLVDYLGAVEAMPWMVFWEMVDIRMVDYPTASITLRVYTLGISEEWIGV